MDKTGKKMMPPVKSSIILGFKQFNYETQTPNVESRYQSQCAIEKGKKDDLAFAQLSILNLKKGTKFDRSKSVQRSSILSGATPASKYINTALMNNIDLKNPIFKDV